MTLTNTSKELQTILPDGTTFKVWNAGTGWGIEHRIGEHKRIFLEYSSDTDLTGFNVFINPALFLPIGYVNTISGKGSIYYACPYTPTSGVEYVCTFQSALANPQLNSARNIEVKLIPDGTNLFLIQIDFYMTADTKNYLQAGFYNENRFLQDAFDNPQVLDIYNTNRPNFAVPGNVYNAENISPRVYVYLEKTNPFPPVTYAVEEKFLGFRAGWFYRDDYNQAPFFTNTHFEIERQGLPVSNFMPNGNNVTVYAVSSNAAAPVTHFVVGIAEYFVNDQVVDFVQSGGIEWQLIEASNPGAGKITGPMTDPTVAGLNYYKAEFKIGNLIINHGYRLIGIAYHKNPVTGAYYVNSFISPLILADGANPPTGDGFEARAVLGDYNREFTGNDLECVIEERMYSEIEMLFPFNKWKNYLFDRFGIVAQNDIREYLDSVELQIYEEYPDPFTPSQIIRQYVDMKSAAKTGVNSLTFSTPAGMTFNFGNTWARFRYEWRNRFEIGTLNVETTNAGNVQYPPTSNQYWGGRTFKIDWILYFIYPQFVVTDKVIFQQQIRVKDYGEMAVKHVVNDPDDPGFDDVQNICNDGETCFAGILQNPSLEDMKLIVNILPNGGTLNSMEEAEVWAGNQLPQLTTSKIINEEEDFHPLYSETAATFCIDGSKLNVDLPYYISAMAKKYVDTGLRITEIGENRITESNNKRITE